MNINAHNKDRDCRAQGRPVWPPSESRPRAASKSPARFPGRKSGLPDLRTIHADLGQARDQCAIGAIPEFQFPE
jgi:hypothetical protein